METFKTFMLAGTVLAALAVGAADPAPAATNAAPAAAKKPAEVKPTAVDDLETRTFVLKYAKAQEVADSLNRLCEKLKLPEAAVAFPESHSVAVAGSKKVVEACAKIVADVDRKPKQVYVEARFFDLLAADVGALGMDWSMFGSTSVNGGLTPLSVDGNSSFTAADGKGIQNAHYFQGTLSASGLHLALAALRVNRDCHMFANPKVVVASGKKAVVDITTKRPNVIVSSKRVLDNGSNSLDIDTQLKEIPGKDELMFAGEAFFWWGVGLLVEPYVGEDGVISARIVPNVSALSDISMQSEGQYVKVSSSGEDSDDRIESRFPIIDVKRIETEFSLKSGETAVIGGLAKTEHEDIDTGIPVLSKIPGLKWLFGQTTRINRQREILVLVTMGIVDPEAPPDKKEGAPHNAFLSREFLDGTKKEPGDHTKEELEDILDRNRKFFNK